MEEAAPVELKSSCEIVTVLSPSRPVIVPIMTLSDVRVVEPQKRTEDSLSLATSESRAQGLSMVCEQSAALEMFAYRA